MKFGLNSRQGLLWTALALSVLATIWTSLAEDAEQDLLAVRSPGPAAQAQQPTPGRIQLAALATPAEMEMGKELGMEQHLRQLQRPRWEDSEAGNKASNDAVNAQMHDPFQSRSSQEQARQAEASQQNAQQAMEIPSLPFSYAGKIVDNGQTTVFLSVGEQNYSVKRGDVVLGWQVKSISPPTMIMRYQAMQMDVPLMIGEQN